MFCKNCGTKLDDDALFCNNCGTKVDRVVDAAVSEVEVPKSEAPKAEEPKVEIPKVEIPKVEIPKVDIPKVEIPKTDASRLSSFITGKTVIAFVAVVLFAIILSVGMKISKKINLDKYVVVEFNGYDTMGTASWKFDYDKFEKDYGTKLKINKSKVAAALKKEGIAADSILGSEMLSAYTATDILREGLSGSLDKSTELTNGDEVTFSWNISEDDDVDFFNYKLKYSDGIDFKVSGLEELGTFDPFSGIEIKYSGIAPNGMAEVEVNNRSGVYGDINYSVEPQSGLSVGDTIKVKADVYYDDFANYTAREYGVIPSATEKEFTVDGLSEYVTKLDDISDDAMASMKSQGEDILKSRASSWDEAASIESIDYVGSYLLSGKSQNTYPFNKITLVFKVTVEIDKDIDDKPDVHDTFTYFYPVTYQELIKLEDGKVSVDVTTYNVAYDNFAKEYDFGGWWPSNLYFDGYEKIDTLFNKLVTSNVENYSYDTDIED